MQDFKGKQIGHYLILNPAGAGGMALVYKAYDLRVELDVAIKMIRVDEIPPSQLQRLMKRFEREVETQSRFSHPNIVPVLDYGKHEDIPYLVLKYLPGGTLKEKLTGPITIVEALKILIPIADAVAYAHSKNVLHRDIKPSNIIFDEYDQALLADFGIAKVLETNEGTLTGTGLGVGTPEYMAPEQWQGKATEASDQYALGVLLYEMLTGTKPYTAETPLAVALKQLNEPLVRPTDLVPDIPPDIENLIFKVLAKNPIDRFSSVKDFRDRLVVLVANYAPALKSEFTEHLPTVPKEIQTRIITEGQSEVETPESLVESITEVKVNKTPGLSAEGTVDEMAVEIPEIEPSLRHIGNDQIIPGNNNHLAPLGVTVSQKSKKGKVAWGKRHSEIERVRTRNVTPAKRIWVLGLSLIVLIGLTWSGISILLKSDFLRQSNAQSVNAVPEIASTSTSEIRNSEAIVAGELGTETPTTTTTTPTETTTLTTTPTFTATATILYIPPTNTSAPVDNDPAPAPTTETQPTDDPNLRPPTPSP